MTRRRQATASTIAGADRATRCGDPAIGRRQGASGEDGRSSGTDRHRWVHRPRCVCTHLRITRTSTGDLLERGDGGQLASTVVTRHDVRSSCSARRLARHVPSPGACTSTPSGDRGLRPADGGRDDGRIPLSRCRRSRERRPATIGPMTRDSPPPLREAWIVDGRPHADRPLRRRAGRGPPRRPGRRASARPSSTVPASTRRSSRT